MALSGEYGNRTVTENLPYHIVAKAIEESPKRRYAYGPPNLTATVRFSEPSGNNFLDAEETGKLTVTVTNTGRGDAFGVTAELGLDKPLRGLNFDTRHAIGAIAAGKSVTRELPFTAAKEIASADLRFTVNVREAGGFDAESLQIAFRSKAFEPPRLMVADLGIEDQSGNAKIEPQEIVEVTARVQNVGYGIARRVMVDVVPGENVLLTGESVKRFELGELAPGKYRDVKFSFYTNRRIANGEIIPIRLLLSEERSEYNVTKPLKLAMNAPQKRTEEIVVKGEEAPRQQIELAGGLRVDVDHDIPAGQKGGRDDIAVVIGNRIYQRGTPNVDYAQRDARIMKEYLTQTLGYEEGNIFYEEDAGLATFNAIFGSDSDHRGKLFNNVREGKSRVFVYYVGHGVPDPNTHEAFFLPVDADTQSLRTSGYRLQTFYDNLAKLPAREITVVLDACFSGNSAKGELLKGRSGIGMVRKAQQPAIATIFTSAQDDQYSVWYAEKKHSLFTYYFLKGLRGEADADRDKRITVGEMEKYLGGEVPYMARKLHGTQQQPTVSGSGAQVIAELR